MARACILAVGHATQGEHAVTVAGFDGSVLNRCRAASFETWRDGLERGVTFGSHGRGGFPQGDDTPFSFAIPALGSIRSFRSWTAAPKF
jgi:hypothetical protein